MENSTLMQQLFQEYLDQGGAPKITSFRFHIEKLMKTEIKQLCGGSRRLAPGAHDWRNDLKARFGGRGSKWMRIELDEIQETLDRLDNEGIDTEDYRNWTQGKGYAWIRYQKPRIINGVNSASFEVRTLQSTIDQPHSLHHIPVDRLDEVLTSLGGTPYSLGLEISRPHKTRAELLSNRSQVVESNDQVEVDDQMLEDLADLENLDL